MPPSVLKPSFSFCDDLVKPVAHSIGRVTPSHLRESGRFVRRDSGIFRNPDHGEDLLEVWRQPEDSNGAMARGALLDEHLDDDRDTGGIDVINATEVQKHLLDFAHAV